MKRIITLSSFILLTTVFLLSCYKERINVIDERYWLSKERGVVVFSSANCPYYIVDTYNGYAVFRAVGYMPYEGDVLYGDMSYYGTRDFYNRTDGSLISADVRDYWLSYGGAQDAIDFYCY